MNRKSRGGPAHWKRASDPRNCARSNYKYIFRARSRLAPESRTLYFISHGRAKEARKITKRRSISINGDQRKHRTTFRRIFTCIRFFKCNVRNLTDKSDKRYNNIKEKTIPKKLQAWKFKIYLSIERIAACTNWRENWITRRRIQYVSTWETFPWPTLII